MTDEYDRDQGVKEANDASARPGIDAKRTPKPRRQTRSPQKTTIWLDPPSGARESDQVPGHPDLSTSSLGRSIVEMLLGNEIVGQFRIGLRPLAAGKTTNRRPRNSGRRVAAPAGTEDTPHSRLKALREARGYRTPEACAKACKMDPQLYKSYEAGKAAITRARSQLFGQILGVDASYILCKSA